MGQSKKYKIINLKNPEIMMTFAKLIIDLIFSL